MLFVRCLASVSHNHHEPVISSIFIENPSNSETFSAKFAGLDLDKELTRILFIGFLSESPAAPASDSWVPSEPSMLEDFNKEPLDFPSGPFIKFAPPP